MKRTFKSIISAVMAGAMFFNYSGLGYAQLASVNNVEAGSYSAQVTADNHVLENVDNGTRVNFNNYNVVLPTHTQFNVDGGKALYKVVGGEASLINNAWSSNGRIFLINQNGITFGSGARVDMPGLVASTMNLSSEDFANGRYVFARNGSNGAVVNDGSILIRNGGYVALLAPEVRNTGSIVASLGNVVLASGNKATLALDDNGDISVTVDEALSSKLLGQTTGVTNSGSIQANGGKVLLTAKALNGLLDRAVNNSGIIQANTVVNKKGSIELVADGNINVAAGSLLEAKATDVDGQGGTVIVKSTEGTTVVEEGAVIDVSGGLASGDAGFVEVSGKEDIGFYGMIRGDAAEGYQKGSVLFDPTNIRVNSLGVDWTILGTRFIDANIIKTMSNAGLALTFQATNNINILVDLLGLKSAIAFLAGNDISLATSGGNAVNVSSNGKSITMTADADNNGTGGYSMANGSSVKSFGGNISISGRTAYVTEVDAGTGNVSLRAVTITSDTNAVTRVRGNNVDIASWDSIGSTGNRFGLSANSVDATSTNGSLVLENDKAVALTAEAHGDVNVRTSAGSIEATDVVADDDVILNAADDVVVHLINAGNEARLTAGRDVLGNGSLDLLTATVANITAGANVFLNTNVDQVEVNAGAAVDLANDGDLVIRDLSAGTTASVVADGGDLQVNKISAPAASVALTGTNIVDNGDASDKVEANELTLTADNNVTINDLKVNKVAADAGNDVTLHNNGGLIIGVNGLGILAGGNVDVSASSPLTVNSDINAAGDIALAANGAADGDLIINAELSTGLGDIDLDAGRDFILNGGIWTYSGNANVDATRDVILAGNGFSVVGLLSIDAGNNITQNGGTIGSLNGGDVSLTAGNAITQNFGVIWADELALDAVNDITLVGPIYNTANALTANSDNGSINYKNTGDLVVRSVTAANGNVGLESTGSLLDDANNATVVQGSAVNLVAANGIGSGANGALDTDADFLNITAGSQGANVRDIGSVTLNSPNIAADGDLNIETVDALTLGGNVNLTGTSKVNFNVNTDNAGADSFDQGVGNKITTAGGNVDVTVGGNGNAYVGKINANGGDITLTAGNDVDEVSVGESKLTGNVVSLYAGNGIGAGVGQSNDAMNTSANVLNATAGTGGIYITEDNGALLNSITAVDGNIRVIAKQGNLDVKDVDAGAADVTLRASNGSVLDAASMIKGNVVSLVGNGVNGAIGAVTAFINTTANTLRLTANGGGVYVNEQDGAVIKTLVTNGGDAVVNNRSGELKTLTTVDTQGGDLTLTSADNLTIGNSSAHPLLTDGGNITLIADSDSNHSGLLTINADVLAIDGNILLEANDMDINDLVFTMGDITAAARGGATMDIGYGTGAGELKLDDAELAYLRALGLITLGSADTGAMTVDTVDLSSNNVKLQSNDTVMGVGIDPDIKAKELTVIAPNGIDLSTDVDLLNLSALNGDIAITQQDDLVIGLVAAGDDVALTSVDGAIVDGNAGANNIDADAVVLTAKSGIGNSNALETTVNSLAASNTDNNIEVANTGALSITGVTNGAGEVIISAASPLTVAGNVLSGGNVTLSSANDGGDNDHLTVNANVTSTSGNVNLNAGTDLVQGAASTVSAGNNVNAGAVRNISLAGVVSAVNNVGLTAVGGAIVQTTGKITGKTLDASAPGAITLTSITNDVDTLNAHSTISGSINFRDVDDVILNDVDTKSGNIFVTAGNDVQIINVDAIGNADITSTNGAITNDALLATGLTANKATLRAKTGINGNGDVNTLDAKSTNGDVVFVDSDDIILDPVEASNGNVNITAITTMNAKDVKAVGAGNDVTLTAGGNVTVGKVGATDDVNITSTDGAIVDDGGFFTALTRITGDKATLRAKTGIGASAPLQATVNTLDAQTTSGDIQFNELNAFFLEHAITGGGNINIQNLVGNMTVADVQATGNVDLSAVTGAILNDGNDATGITANVLTLWGANGVDANGNVNTLNASTSNGDINYREAGDVIVASAQSLISGNVNIQAVGAMNAQYVNARGSNKDVNLTAGNNLTVGEVKATRTATLIASNGAIVDGSDATTNVTALNADFTAKNGIGTGNALETRVSNLKATNTNNNIEVANTGALTLTNFGGTGNAVTNGTGNVIISAASPLTVSSKVLSGGNITLTSGNDGGDNDHLTVAADVQSTNGSVNLNAGTDLVQNTGTLIDAKTNVGLNAVRNISLAGIVSAVNNIVMTASGAIAQTAGKITGKDLNAQATGAITLGQNTNDVDTLTAKSTVAGNIVYNDADAVELTDVNTKNGAITVTAGGAINAKKVISQTDNDANDITLVAVTGNVTLGDVNAGTIAGDLNVTATLGQIVDDGNAATLATADVLTLTALSGIDVDTNVNSLVAKTTGAGNIRIDELNAITLTDVNTKNGAITVTAGGAINAKKVISQTDNDANDITLVAVTGNVTLGDVNAGTTAGDLNVTATLGQIVDDGNAATLATADVLTLTALSGIDVDTNVNSLVAKTTGAGNIRIDELNAITLTDVNTKNGAITVNAGGTITAVNVVSQTNSDANDVALTANGSASDILLGLVDAKSMGDVVLTAGNRIIDNNDSGSTHRTNVIADDLILSAANGIGSTNALETEVSDLKATNTNSGDINISNEGGLTLTNFGSGNAVTNNGGAVDISAHSPLTVSSKVQAKGNITLTAANETNSADNLTVNADIQSTNGGKIDLNAGDDFLQNSGTISTSGDVDVTAGDDARFAGVVSADDINIDAGDEVTQSAGSILGDVLTVNAGGKILINQLTNDVNTLNAESQYGDITFYDMDSAYLNDVEAMDGDIVASVGGTMWADYVRARGEGNVTLTAHNDVVVNEVIAIDNDVFISAETGAIEEMAPTGSSTDITARNLTLEAVKGIGSVNALETEVSNLKAINTTSGNVNISNEGGLTLTNFGSGNAVTNNGGAVDISAHSPLTVSSKVQAKGNITLTAANETNSADNLTVNADIQSTNGGKIDLNAGDDFLQNSGTISTSGDVDVTAGDDARFAGIVSADDINIDAGDEITQSAGSILGDVLTANAGGKILINQLTNDVNTLNAESQYGDITFYDMDSAYLNDVEAMDGDIVASVGGTMWADYVRARGEGNVTLTAHNDVIVNEVIALDNDVLIWAETGAIEEMAPTGSGADITARNLTLQAATGIGNLNALETEVSNLKATNTNSGNINIVNDGGLTLTNFGGTGNAVTNNGGAVDISAHSPLTVASAVVAAGNVTLTSANDGGNNDHLTVNANVQSTSGDVNLNAGTDLVQGAASTISAGNNVNGTAVRNISLAGVVSAVNNVALTAGQAISQTTGRITGTILNANATRSISLTSNTNDVDTVNAHSTTSGNISFNDADDVILNDVDTANGAITVNAGGTITATDVQSLTDNGANDITLNAISGNVVLGYVNAGLTAGDVIVSAANGQIIENGDAAADVIADNASFTALTGVNVDTTVASLNANVTGAGNVTVDETDALTVNDVRTANGNVGITAGGSMLVDYILAAGVGDVTLTSGGAITQGYGPAADIIADLLTMTAVTGIDVDTNVNTLTAHVTGAGSILVDETDNIALLNVDTFNGNITINANGDVTQNGGIVRSRQGGDISITADADNSGAGDFIQNAGYLDADGVNADININAVNAQLRGLIADGFIAIGADNDVFFYSPTNAGGGSGTYTPVQIPAEWVTGGLWTSLLNSGMTYMDDTGTTLNLAFLFPFYGSNYSNLFVSTNGYVAPGVTLTGNLWNLSADNAYLSQHKAIAASWSDWFPSDIQVQTTADRAVIQWTGDHCCHTGNLNMQMILEATGAIQFNYGAMSYGNNYVAQGVSSGDGVNYAVGPYSMTTPTSYSGAQSVVFNGGLPVVAQAGGNVSITAGGKIVDSNGTALDIKADSATLTANTGIGATDAIDTQVNTLTALNNGVGDIAINEKDAVTLSNVRAAAGNATVTAGGNVTLGYVRASNTASITATGDILDIDLVNEPLHVEADTINLNATGSVGTDAVNGDIDIAGNNVNVTAGGDVFIEEADGATFSVNSTSGRARILAHGTSTLGNSSVEGDFYFGTSTGDINFNGTTESRNGGANIFTETGNMYGMSAGYHVVAADPSFLSTPRGTMGLNGHEINVNIDAPLTLNIGNAEAAMSGRLNGIVKNPLSRDLPTFYPVSFPTPLIPPGKVYFNGNLIWPKFSSLISSALTNALLARYQFPTAERLAMTDINVMDVTSSRLVTPVYFYHPLTEVDSGSYDNFLLEEGAYDFIDGQLNVCTDDDLKAGRCKKS